MKSFAQYILSDSPSLQAGQYVGWSSGLITYTAQKKPTYDAWRMPLYLPATSTKAGHTLEVWGCVRPATYAFADTGQPQTAEIQFAPRGSGSYSTVRTLTITRNCYFDVRVRFPSSGTVRVVWRYPAGDPLLGDFPAADPSDGSGYTDPLLGSPGRSDIVDSRSAKVTIK